MVIFMIVRLIKEFMKIDIYWEGIIPSNLRNKARYADKLISKISIKIRIALRAYVSTNVTPGIKLN